MWGIAQKSNTLNKIYLEIYFMEGIFVAKIIIFNNDTNRMETYYRGENDVMPYNANRSLTVGEFRGSSGSPTLWTTKRAMQSFNTTRYLFRKSNTCRFCI